MTKGARAEDAILRAALDLLGAHGVAGLTVDAVAARAGVGKQTIYRHWGSRARLIHAAIACSQAPFEEPDTGSLRDDLIALLRQVVELLTNSEAGRVFPSLLDAAERDPELAALREETGRTRRAAFERVFRRAVERGELDAGTDLALAIDLVLAPFFYRRLVSRAPLSEDRVAPVVDAVLSGLSGLRAAPAKEPRSLLL